MTAPQGTNFSPASLRRIDKICDAFEFALKRGEQPPVEEFVGALSGREAELVRLELGALIQQYQSKTRVVTSAQEFADSLLSAQVISADDLSKFWDSASPPSVAVSELADELVCAGCVTRFQADTALQGGRLALGNYSLLDELGKGGMGQVFRARHRRMDRIVALKILSQEAMQSTDAVERFHREVKTIASLSHANIVTAYDADEADGLHFLVMENVAGSDLSTLVRSQGPLSVHGALSVAVQAATGLQYVHEKGFIHRDVKPSNLLLDQSGVVKILDLGLARVGATQQALDEITAGALTARGMIMGTVDYMAPEQAEDCSSVDHRVDIYGLGCTLYYLLTGGPVYPSTNPVKSILAHREAPIPSLREEREDVPAEIDAVFSQMTAKLPQDRQESMQQVVEQLQHCLPTTTQTTNASETPTESHAVRLTPTATMKTAEQDTDSRSIETVSQQPETSSLLKKPGGHGISRFPWILVAAIGLLTVGVLGVVMRIEMSKGVLEIKTHDRHVQVSVAQDGEQVTIVDTKTNASIKLIEGKYEVSLLGDDNTIHLDKHQLTLKRGEKEIVEVVCKSVVPDIGDPEPVPVAVPFAVRKFGEDRLMHWNYVSGVVFLDDGDQVVSASRDGTVCVWDWKNAECLKTLTEHGTEIYGLAYCREKGLVATGDMAGTVHLWSTNDWTHVDSFDTPDTDTVDCLAFAEDGSVLIVGGQDGIVRTWNIAAGGEPKPFGDASARVRTLAVDGDRGRIAAAGDDGKIQIWSYPDAAPLPPIEAHEGCINSLVFSRSGTLVSGGVDGFVRTWQPESGREMGKGEGYGNVTAVRFSDDETKLIVVNKGNFNVLDAETLELEESSFSALAVQVMDLHPDRRVAVTGGTDCAIRVWDLDKQQELPIAPTHRANRKSVAFSPDSKRLLSGIWQEKNGLTIWPLDGTANEQSIDVPAIDDIAFSAVESYPAYASHYELYVRNPDDPATLMSLEGRECLAFNHDGTLLASPSPDNSGDIVVWDWRAKSREATLSGLLSGRVTSVDFHPAKNHLVAADEHGRIAGWDIDLGEELWETTEHNRWLGVVRYNFDGSLLALAGWRPLIHVWDARTGKPLETLRGHMGLQIMDLAFSPIDNLLASGGNDGTVRFWKLQDNAWYLVKTLQIGPVGGGINAVAIDSMGLYVACANANGTAMILEVPIATELTADMKVTE